MKLLLTFTFLSIAFFSSCQNSGPVSTIIYTKSNYTIEYPANWRIDTLKAPAVEFTLYSPRENINDNFSENVNLIIQNLAGQNIDLDKYAELSEKQIRAHAVALTGYTSKKNKNNKYEFYELEYEMTYNSFRLHTKQYYFAEDEKAIVLTFTSEINKPEEMKMAGNKILRSFSYHSK